MKVILIKDVKGLGQRFEEKDVSDGYGTNFLIPKKLAVPLSSPGAAAVRALKEREEATKKEKKEKFSANTHALAGEKIVVKAKANDVGHLFAALDTKKVSEIIKSEKGLEIGVENIVLKKPIKEIGTFEVPIRVGDGKEARFTLEVIRS